MDIQLKLPKTSFTLAEDIEVGVRVVNTSGQPMQVPDPFFKNNWQPVYTLSGPGHPSGHRFSFRSAVVGDTRPNPSDVPLKLVDLAPGQVLEAEIPLHKWVALKEPGAYRLTAAFDWGSLKVVSTPVDFSLDAHQLVSLSLGIDVATADSRGYWLEWLQTQAPGQAVYSALYRPPERDQPGFRPFSVAPVFQAGDAAQDVLSPWTSYNRQSELYKWRAWREKSTLLALTSGSTQPQRLSLPAPPLALVRPALMARQGELDVMVLGTPRTLMLARFMPPAANGTAPPPRIVWTHTLPHDALAVSAAVLPDVPDARRQAVVVGEAEGALLVSLLTAPAQGAPTSAGPVRVGEVRPLPDSTPAVRLDSRGLTQVSVLVVTVAAPQRIGLVDLSFGPDGKLTGPPRVSALPALATAVKAGTVGYSVGTEPALRRHWAVLLDSGRVLSPGRPSGGTDLVGKAVLPLQLLPTSEGNYLLGIDPRLGPTFNLLP